ncbi:flagellar basal body-associated protein FliL [Candidatus Endobugula sertula]|uniref:Flagellar protein FliL n=1 Tax=Candidatus Endobugula sertula TaxID=62101 RepID=A0A1D2QN44_9GAMM|nr:flagellar basal body-associated protein FliL [Candidatus Endobugula sertula]
MADDNAEGGKPQAGSGKKKIIIFVVLAVVLIGVSIGGTLFAVQMMTPELETAAVLNDDGKPSSSETEETNIKKPAIYLPLKPPIIVNFQARGRQRFLQAEITLMAREDDVIEAVKIHMPMIRNSLILLFGGQIYEELQTEAGRELLRQQALEELQAVMEQEMGKPGIERLLFTNLVMQ